MSRTVQGRIAHDGNGLDSGNRRATPTEDRRTVRLVRDFISEVVGISQKRVSFQVVCNPAAQNGLQHYRDLRNILSRGRNQLVPWSWVSLSQSLQILDAYRVPRLNHSVRLLGIGNVHAPPVSTTSRVGRANLQHAGRVQAPHHPMSILTNDGDSNTLLCHGC